MISIINIRYPFRVTFVRDFQNFSKLQWKKKVTRKGHFDNFLNRTNLTAHTKFDCTPIKNLTAHTKFDCTPIKNLTAHTKFDCTPLKNLTAQTKFDCTHCSLQILTARRAVY